MLGLTKVLVDSLNDREIAKSLGGALPDEKSIAKLQRFLTTASYPEVDRDIGLLRLLQDARSGGPAHRKDDARYAKLTKNLGLERSNRSGVFAALLTRSRALLVSVAAHFCTADEGQAGGVPDGENPAP